MDFDQMLEAWKAQEEAPLYGVNSDLLQLVLQHEQAKIRRTMRLGKWVAYIVGPGMALFSAFWLWVAILNGVPVLHAAAAALAAVTFAVWIGAFWVSRRRLARRERGFGNTLRDEIGRSLSLVEYRISQGHWRAGLLWSAPVIIGALLVQWLTFQINTDTGLSSWGQAGMMFVPVGAIVVIIYAEHLHVKQKLEPRRQRLRELLEALEAGE
jgi:hypothetical protein